MKRSASRASVVTLGCPKNLVDSEHILGVLGRAGYVLTDQPEDSDVIIINTCGFLRSAVTESERVIQRCLQYKAKGRVKQVIVAGCLVQRAWKRLKDTFPEIDALVGIDQIRRLPDVIGRGTSALGAISTVSLRSRQRWRSHTQRNKLDEIPAPIRAPDIPRGLCNATFPRLVSTPRHYVYLRIADGCDNCCSYCLIPNIRGRFRSRPVTDVVREAGMLADAGARELILIAQDTTRYGEDLEGRKMLAILLRRLSQIPGVEWLRVMYTHPAHYTSELIEELGANSRIVKYVDLPVQHISDRILRRMNRPYRRSDVEALLSRLRNIPGMAFRTTLIAGFPGETEQEFRELRDFVAQGCFTHMGCFTYSPEPGTRAARLAGQLPLAVRESRVSELMRVQRRISLGRSRAQVGKTIEVRLDSAVPALGEFLGRTYADAPEIDNTVHVHGKDLLPGALVKVKITKARAYDLVGAVIPE